MKNAALVLIETQNEWLAPEGKLQAFIQDRSLFERSVIGIEKALGFARKVRMPVVYVGLRFKKGYPELANGKAGLRKAIPQVGTFPENAFGSAFYEPFQPLENEFVVSGRTGASGFAGSNLDIYLRTQQIETLYIAGYATHVCVESTFREAHDKAYTAVVLSDACAAFNEIQQAYFLKEVVHHFGKAITTEEFTCLD
ncbi:cysteine hydrolase [Rapidithrix thailandica]|uniref:Cysteine hydrolase n=1 Tax=Rapidithrix thailandica TaxID=413964 RepID=A0AAW9RZW6_9BACT